jgi:hypothetical protein
MIRQSGTGLARHTRSMPKTKKKKEGSIRIPEDEIPSGKLRRKRYNCINP